MAVLTGRFGSSSWCARGDPWVSSCLLGNRMVFAPAALQIEEQKQAWSSTSMPLATTQ